MSQDSSFPESYLWPTDKYDLINIIEENSGEDSDHYNTIEDNQPKEKERLLASSEIIFTPCKNKKNLDHTKVQSRSCNNSMNFTSERTPSPNKEFILIKSGSEESLKHIKKPQKEAIGDTCAEGNQNNLNLTSELTNDSCTQIKEGSANKTKSSKKPSNPPSTKKPTKPKNGMMKTCKTALKQIEPVCNPIKIKFGNQIYNKIKRTMKDDLASVINEVSKSPFISRSNVKATQNKVDFDVENSKTNIYLSKLICTRIEENEYIQSKAKSSKNTIAICELKSRLARLQNEIKVKQNKIQECKAKGTGIPKSKSSHSFSGQKSCMDELSEQDLYSYISQLKELKAKILLSELYKPETSDYMPSFNKRHAGLVREIDLKGIDLNDTISKYEPTINLNNLKISKANESLRLKNDEINYIKHESYEVDHKCLNNSEVFNTNLERYLMKLTKIIKTKGALSSEIKLIDSDILQFKIKIDDNVNKNILGTSPQSKCTNVNKIKLLRYLNSKLQRINQNRNKIRDNLKQSAKILIPEPNLSSSSPSIVKSIKFLRHSLKESRNEESFLLNDINKYDPLLKSFSNCSSDDKDTSSSFDIFLQSQSLCDKRMKNIIELKSMTSMKISLNFQIFEKHKALKELEAKVEAGTQLKAKDTSLNSEIKNLDKKPEEKKTINNIDTSELKTELDQKNRMISYLNRNLVDLNDKIEYIKAKVPFPHCHDSCIHSRVKSTSYTDKGYQSVPCYSYSINQNQTFDCSREQFEPLDISEHKLRMLFPKRMNIQLKRISKYMYEIYGTITKLLTDKHGDVYVKTTNETLPFNKFINRLDKSVPRFVNDMKNAIKKCNKCLRKH